MCFDELLDSSFDAGSVRNRMRILVAHDVPRHHIGGMNRIMRFTHDLLVARGHHVDYFYSEDAPSRRLSLRRFGFPWAVFQHAMRGFKRGEAYDVVNVHEVQGAAIARLKHFAGNPYVVLTSHGAEHRAWDLALDEKKLGREGPALRTLFLNPTTRLSQIKLAIEHADHLMCLSEQDREYFELHMNVDRGRTSRIFPGASPTYYASDPARLSRPFRNIVFGGTWRKNKGIEDVLVAFSRLARKHAHLRLTVLGAGVSPETLRSQFPDDVATRIDVLETSGDRQNLEQLQQADAFLLPSLFEGTPLTLMEAMAAALPIVTTNTSGMKDVIHDGENGLLIPIRQPDAIVSAIEQLMADASLRIRLATEAQQDAQERYTWERSAANIGSIYERILSSDRTWAAREYNAPDPERRLRFCFVSNFVPNWNSGAAGSILAIGSHLEKLGHSVQFCWQERNQLNLGKSSLNNVFVLPGVQLRQVRRHLRANPADVVVVSQPFAYPIFEQLPKEFPSTLFLNLTHGWENRDDVSEIVFESSGPFRGKRAWKRIGTMLLRARACRRTANSMQGFLAPCFIDGHFVHRTYGVEQDKLLLMTYGLDDSFFHTTAKPRTSPPGRRMLFFGQYFPRKGSHLLERILPRIAGDYADAEVTFIVPNEQAASIDAAYREAVGDRLHVLNWMDRTKVAEIAAEHDILLFPSYLEGFGKTFLEGMAWGLCVTGFAEGGLPDIAINGEHAMYCAVGDEPGYEALLRRCLDDPGMTRKIGDCARVRAHQYTWKQTAEKLLAFSSEKLASR